MTVLYSTVALVPAREDMLVLTDANVRIVLNSRPQIRSMHWPLSTNTSRR